MLEVTNLRSGYGVLEVLHGVSMRMEHGESIALVGVNGAGKTTLVRTLMGLNSVTGGRIVKDGVDITHRPAHHRPGLGIAALLENRRLFGEMTIRENLRLAEVIGKSLRGDRQRFKWEDVCNIFPIVRERQHTAVSLLSGGQQQMVATARALLLQSDFLILDEPSTGLAPKIVKEMFQIFQDLRSSGLGILLVEQNIRVAIDMTSRAYIMSLGRIVDEATGAQWTEFASDERLLNAYLGAT